MVPPPPPRGKAARRQIEVVTASGSAMAAWSSGEGRGRSYGLGSRPQRGWARNQTRSQLNRPCVDQMNKHMTLHHRSRARAGHGQTSQLYWAGPEKKKKHARYCTYESPHKNVPAVALSSLLRPILTGFSCLESRVKRGRDKTTPIQQSKQKKIFPVFLGVLLHFLCWMEAEAEAVHGRKGQMMSSG
jgi:hypothetical protein